MHIGEVCSIVEAVLILSALTKRTWTEDEFVRAVIRFRLPVYAAAPYDASIVFKRYVNDRLVVTEEPSLHAQYITLLQAEIEEVAYSQGPQIITDRPAWLPGDKPYRSWEEIAAFRKGDHRVLGHWETGQGEWMGQSHEYFFSAPVGVTAQSTFVVPRHTIAELVRDDLTARSKPASEFGATIAPAPIPAKVAPVLKTSTSAPRLKTANTWDHHNLRRLLEESRMPGNTQAVLADKYGVTRQSITKQLAKAKDVHGVRPSSPFDVLNGRGRKK